MQLEVSFILILGFIFIYVLLIKIYSVLFRLTGLTKEKATFQVISLLTNSGYTTQESEVVTKERPRRKIALASMITGNVFSVVIVSLVISLFSNIQGGVEENTLNVVGIAFIVFVCVIVFFNLPFVSKKIDKLIEKIGVAILQRKQKENVLTLLDSMGNVSIVEVIIKDIPEIMDGKSLIESGLKDKYNVNILTAKRGDRNIEVTKDTIFQNNDQIIAFGTYQNIKDLFTHPKKSSREINELMDVSRENQISIIDNYGKDALVEIQINAMPEFMINQTLEDSKIKDTYGLNVMMVKRNEEIIPLTRNTIIKTKDSIVVFGDYHTIKSIFIKNIK